MAETASGSTSTPARKPRGANPSADYKSLFLKSKGKYDRVSTDHTELVANVTKAAAKHQKLREELDFLLDAIASKQAQRAHIEQAHRDRAIELEREAAAAVVAAAAARRHASSLSRADERRDREVYESRASYEAAEEYRGYGAERRYEEAELSRPTFGAGMGGRRYASPGAVPVQTAACVVSQGADGHARSEASPSRELYVQPSYRGAAPSQSPPSRRAHAPEQHSPSRYETQQRYREPTPPLPPLAAKRPRPLSVERELLETGEPYDADPRERGSHVKRARND